MNKNPTMEEAEENMSNVLLKQKTKEVSKKILKEIFEQ